MSDSESLRATPGQITYGTALERRTRTPRAFWEGMSQEEAADYIIKLQTLAKDIQEEADRRAAGAWGDTWGVNI